MKIFICDDLNNKQIETLYNFVKKNSNNINNFNKNIDTNILWNIIYLKKLLQKTLHYTRRLSKIKTKYEYVIFKKTEIICYFNFIIKEKNVVELFIVLDEKNNLDDNKKILENIIKQINDYIIASNNINNFICALYVNKNSNNFYNLIENTNYFTIIFEDNITYLDKYDVFYYVHEKNKINEHYIFNTLQNIYNLTNIIEPISKQTYHKLTLKNNKIKICTKDIFDIHEIQNTKYENYDYYKISFLKNADFIFYIFNNKNYDITQFIMNRYFNGNKTYNERLLNIFKNKYQYGKNIDYNLLYDIFKKNNNEFNINNFDYKKYSAFQNFVISNIMKKIINNTNNSLIITNSIDDIINYKEYNINIICLKQQVDNKKDMNFIKNIKNNISFCFNNIKYNNIISNYVKNNKLFNTIFINTTYINYDYIIPSINIIVKLPFILYTILNSLKVLNKNGSLLIQLFTGNINIPIIEKILYILLNIFEDYNITYITDYRIILTFNKYCGTRKNKFYNVINNLIKEINKFENDEFTMDDIISSLLSNKFYYHINDESLEKIKITPINKKILYDINGINGINNITKFESDKVKKFINTYNKIINEQETYLHNHYNIIEPFFINKNLQFYDEIIKMFNTRIIILFYNMIKYKITENYNVINIINKILIKYKNIDNYIKHN